MGQYISCFKAYDIRGKVPGELNEDLAYDLGRAYAVEVKPQGPVAVGMDIRLSSRALAHALIRGLNDSGVDTLDTGLGGTEMIYFAASRPGMGGGIMVTASHNPMEYNGLKLVREKAIPISSDSGLLDLERRIHQNDLPALAAHRGSNREEDITDEYIAKLLSFVDVSKLKPLKIVANPGNGCAGPVIKALAPHLPFEFVEIFDIPDGSFPNGVPNPLLTENQPVTRDAVLANNAHLGIAWDGDFDRCFFFDENGDFADGYYIVGLLAKQALKQYPGSKIIHDPRLTWYSIEVIRESGGIPVQCKTGHAFVKERMRAENAAYGGEVSAHHYFRDFAYCDTGMVPWLLISTLMSDSGKTLSELVAEGMKRYPISGEINNRVSDAAAVIKAVRAKYEPMATRIDETDGVSLEFDDRWRFNLRSSQTEPILRLNVEARADKALMQDKTAEILEMIK